MLKNESRLIIGQKYKTLRTKLDNTTLYVTKTLQFSDSFTDCCKALQMCKDVLDFSEEEMNQLVVETVQRFMGKQEKEEVIVSYIFKSNTIILERENIVLSARLDVPTVCEYQCDYKEIVNTNDFLFVAKLWARLINKNRIVISIAFSKPKESWYLLQSIGYNTV